VDVGGPVITATLIVAGALYVRLRWQRSPQAYSAIAAVAIPTATWLAEAK
jgi:hypothetical protein